jgi:hypothetical protein
VFRATPRHSFGEAAKVGVGWSGLNIRLLPQLCLEQAGTTIGMMNIGMAITKGHGHKGHWEYHHDKHTFIQAGPVTIEQH